MMKIKKPRGTRDFPPEEMWERDYVENIIEDVFQNYGYRKVLIPTFEHAELFTLKSGEEIERHMYVFKDKSGRDICLRPEATASICRMFAEELRGMKKPIKIYYCCPMFRYERPQRGRYREFWQTGIELIGPENSESDAEVIEIAVRCLEKLGLRYEVEIGHLGILRDLMCKLRIEEDMQDEIISLVDKGDLDGLKKVVKEPVIYKLIGLKGDRNVLEEADSLLKEFDVSRSLEELREILHWLDLVGVNYRINLGIARGLEYYTGMVFEIRVKNLGAQNQICGGGRYDSLIELFSGISVPAVGFSFGFDRVMESIHAQGAGVIPERRMDVVIAPTSADVKEEAVRIASEIRGKYDADLDLMGRRLGKLLEYASEIKARFVIIVGQRDLDEGKVTVRDMDTGEQEKIDVKEIGDFLDERLA